jgi:hypothetical protein
MQEPRNVKLKEIKAIEAHLSALGAPDLNVRRHVEALKKKHGYKYEKVPSPEDLDEKLPYRYVCPARKFNFGKYVKFAPQVVELRREGVTWIEIAKRLGFSTQTVLNALNYAKKTKPRIERVRIELHQ